jgi:hypothetical protein
MSNILEHIAVQYVDGVESHVPWLRMEQTGLDKIDSIPLFSLTGREHNVKLESEYSTELELEEIIITKLLQSGEYLYHNYESESSFKDQLGFDCAVTANEIARQTRRGVGNVFITNYEICKQMQEHPYFSSMNQFRDKSLMYSQFVPDNICIVLYRASPKNKMLRVLGCDGSPILVLNKNNTKQYTWTGEDKTKQYVKIISF